MWDVIADALLDTLKLFPFLLLLYILIELMEHNTRMGRAGAALSGRWAPLLGSATGLVPMCGFSVMAAKLYEKKYLTLGTLLAVFIATSDEALLVLLVSEMGWQQKLVSILSMCAVKFVLGAAVGYLVDLIGKHRALPLSEGSYEAPDCHQKEEHVHEDRDHVHAHCAEHAHPHDHTEPHEGEGEAFTVCEHKHGKRGTLSLYLLSPLWHSLKVAAFVLLVNLAFGMLFYFIGEENVIGFLQGSGYWFQPLICSALGFVPNCASSVILAEVYAVGGISFGSCLGGLVVNAGLGYLVLFRDAKQWKRTLAVCAFMVALGIAVGYAVNAAALAFPAGL